MGWVSGACGEEGWEEGAYEDFVGAFPFEGLEERLVSRVLEEGWNGETHSSTSASGAVALSRLGCFLRTHGW